MKLEPEFIDKLISEFSIGRIHTFSQEDYDFLVAFLTAKVNQRLQEMLRDAPVVYFNDEDSMEESGIFDVSTKQYPGMRARTHKARLVEIEKLNERQSD